MIAASNSPTSVPILERIGIYLYIHTNTDFSGKKAKRCVCKLTNT